LDDSVLDVTGSCINRNTARNDGGGAYGRMSLFTSRQGASVIGNAASRGGGIFMGLSSTLTITERLSICSNSARSDGGGVAASALTL